MNVLIAKTHLIEVDTAVLTDEVKAFVFNYGMKQLLNDAGSAGKDADEKLAMAQKKLDGLYAGEVRRVSAAKASIDPVQAEAERLAWDAIKAGLKAAGRKASEVTDEARVAAVAKYIERNPEVVEVAKRRVEDRKRTTVDLDELGL